MERLSLLQELTSSGVHHSYNLTISSRRLQLTSSLLFSLHTGPGRRRGLLLRESSGRMICWRKPRFSQQCSQKTDRRSYKRRILSASHQMDSNFLHNTDKLLQSNKEMKLSSPASSASASLGWKEQHAELDTVAGPPQRSSTEEADIFYSADSRARYHHLQERFSSLLHLLQVDQKQWQVLVVAHCAAVVVVVGAMVVGMHACAPALAADMTLCPEVASEESAGFFGDVGDIQSGFASAFLLIFFSEIGDKTFFIAALLATRKSNFAVFTGTFGALATMTVISVTLGRAFHYLDGVLPFSLGNMELPLDDLAAVVLLVYFGVSTLLEASSMDGSKAEEEQQEAELAIAGVGANGAQGLQAAAGTVAATFALVFVAEWGDKSFFSTIALAAASSPLGVVTGAIAGHGVATVLAVLGGSFLGTYISEKVIAYVGGALFLVFAAATLVEIVR
ncbi:hypothetical protein CY35_11G021800 [Sphagnum magellanicum]|nr:hypothetical protein CY35_11G021800 [Sphagnum magellanicum]